MLRWLIGIIFGEIICESSNWQHIQRLKITILGANWQLFSLERIAKSSNFILCTQNIKFYWFVMKVKKFMLPILWYNRGLFPLGNKYLGSSFWMGQVAFKARLYMKVWPGNYFLLCVYSSPRYHKGQAIRGWAENFMGHYVRPSFTVSRLDRRYFSWSTH